MTEMSQKAPYPDALASLVERLEYRPDWRFSLEDIDRGQGSEGLTFIAIGVYPDTYHPERTIRVAHFFPIPPAAYNEQSWRRWLFDRIQEIERHEAAEFFKIDGERPYAPVHAPGFDPYMVTAEPVTDEDRRTQFDGTKAENDQEIEHECFNAVLHRQVLQHPLPWHVESDWTEEVRASDGYCIAKCRTSGDAEAIIAAAVALDAERA